MNPQRVLFPLLLSFVAACAPEGNSMTNDTQQTSQQNDQADEFIGLARMEADGTLTLQLYARHDDGDKAIRGQAFFRYPPDHPRYEATLRHVGPIEPGGQRLVRPWPKKSATKP